MDVLKHLTHLRSKAEAQLGLLELPMILVDRWSKEKTRKEEVNKEININSPYRQDAETRTIVSKKHHYPKSQP